MQSKVFLMPCELQLTRQAMQISTLIISGIVVTLYNKVGCFGGMNHFIAPIANNNEQIGRYGDLATRELIELAYQYDPCSANYEAKIFGGAKLVGPLKTSTDYVEENIKIAETILSEFDIKIVEKLIGGEASKRVILNSLTGKTKVMQGAKYDDISDLTNTKLEYSSDKIKILIVDDSATIRNALKKLVADNDDILVVGEAVDGIDARRKLLEYKPDVITLDLVMPNINGFEFLSELMRNYPKPVVVISAVTQRGSKLGERVMKLGAVAVIDKEDLNLLHGQGVAKDILIKAIKSAAATKVIKRDPS